MGNAGEHLSLRLGGGKIERPKFQDVNVTVRREYLVNAYWANSRTMALIDARIKSLTEELKELEPILRACHACDRWMVTAGVPQIAAQYSADINAFHESNGEPMNPAEQRIASLLSTIDPPPAQETKEGPQ